MNKQLLLIACTVVLLAHCVKNKETFKDGRDEGGYPAPSVTIDTNSAVIDVSKYAQARVFPGLVCNTEARLKNHAVTMNLNYNYVKEHLRMAVPPEPQFSTGLYAAPGELVTIDVPADYSLSIQVGAWQDNLSSVLNAPAIR
ncbi:M60 family peptidase N-terminal accessory domain-containing protein [Paraflavitalea speifideaquila]|uniref:M60 family peptidase N-terminal accessory domain-containing protein n=1 Tax=Paraflavitalea speifideaquila TaxID=3076558 RepID=UPI0028EC2DF0|nr:M60 family peptidase N-terminal accessory domain-containing protein [Paraflavitalea speifideiaquila]